MPKEDLVQSPHAHWVRARPDSHTRAAALRIRERVSRKRTPLWRRVGRASWILALAVQWSAASASAQSAGSLTPDSVATEFQAALRGMGWQAAALRIHPEGLRRFHDLIDMLVEVDESGATLEAFFGDMSAARYRALSSGEVFARVLASMRDHMGGLLHALVVRHVEIIGAVSEPPELAHVVYRSEAQLSGAVPELRVMTLKKADGRWLVLETPELEVIREALRGTPRRLQPSPPPPDR